MFALALLGQSSGVSITSTKAFPTAFSPSRSFPVVSNGYILSFGRTVTPQNGATIQVTSLAGIDLQVPFAPPGNAHIAMLTRASMTAAGDLVVAGQSAGSNGTTGFVVEQSLGGKISSAINTGSYIPTQVCSAADGTIWTLGQVPSIESLSVGSDRTALLRAYGVDGVLKGSYLPRNSLPQGSPAPLNLFPESRTFAGLSTRAFLSCGDNTVGSYIGAPFNLWTEVTMGNGKVQQWSVAPISSYQASGGALKGARLSGLVLLSQNRVYGSWEFMDGSRGLYKLKFNSADSLTWVPVSLPSDQIAKLLGRDGGSLIYVTGAASPRNNPSLNWGTPSP